MILKFVQLLALAPALALGWNASGQSGDQAKPDELQGSEVRAMTIVVVEALENEPNATDAKGTQRTLRVGEQIEPGTTITTDIKSKLVLGFQSIDGFGTRDFLILAPLASAALERQPDASDGNASLAVNLHRGAFRSKIADASRQPRFMIGYADHLVHLRKSEVFGDITQDGELATIYVNHGSVLIEAGDRRFQIGEGMRRDIENGQVLGATKAKPIVFVQLQQATDVLNFDLPSVFAGVRNNPGGGPAPPIQPPARVAQPVDAQSAAYVKMTTSEGEIYLELDAARAPITVENFLQYVNEGFYDGTVFHRVMADFMIQGGGFTADGSKKQTHPPIPNEGANDLSNTRGTIAMARTPVPDSATSQFFINVGDNSRLDATPGRPGYAVFGRVVRGMDVVDRIRKLPVSKDPRGEMSVPVDPILIEEVTVITREEVMGAAETEGADKPPV